MVQSYHIHPYLSVAGEIEQIIPCLRTVMLIQVGTVHPQHLHLLRFISTGYGEVVPVGDAYDLSDKRLCPSLCGHNE